MVFDVFYGIMFRRFFIFLNEFFFDDIIYNFFRKVSYIYKFNKGEFVMKKSLKNCVLSLSILFICTGAAFADGNAFTPLNFDDAAYSAAPIRTSAASTTRTVTSPTSVNTAEEPAGNVKMQNAIIQLDNAQIDVRNELLNYKSKYSDIDAQYNAVKAERKALDKQIKNLERRIKKIDKQKENIRKNMV